MRKTAKTNNTLMIASLLLIVFGIAIIIFFGGNNEKPPVDSSVSQSDLGSVEYEGQLYRYNTNVFNILFLGMCNVSRYYFKFWEFNYET